MFVATLKLNFVKKLSNAGFEIRQSRYADSVGFLATLIYKALGKGDGTVNRMALKFYDRWLFPLSRLLDVIANQFIGKNVYVRAIKPGINSVPNKI